MKGNKQEIFVDDHNLSLVENRLSKWGKIILE